MSSKLHAQSYANCTFKVMFRHFHTSKLCASAPEIYSLYSRMNTRRGPTSTIRANYPIRCCGLFEQVISDLAAAILQSQAPTARPWHRPKSLQVRSLSLCSLCHSRNCEYCAWSDGTLSASFVGRESDLFGERCARIDFACLLCSS